MNRSLFIYSPIERHLGYVPALAVANKAAVNIRVRSSRGHVFSAPLRKSQGARLRGCVVRACLVSCAAAKELPQWLRHLHSQQQWRTVPVAPCPRQHLVVSVFWISAMLIDVCRLINIWNKENIKSKEQSIFYDVVRHRSMIIEVQHLCLMYFDLKKKTGLIMHILLDNDFNFLLYDVPW